MLASFQFRSGGKLQTCLWSLTLGILWGSLSCLPAQQSQERKYALSSDSQRIEGVPQGKVTEHQWLESQAYPGTKRRYYVYVPAQYDASKPAALMVFQDGHAYVDDKGQYRATAVMDNLIHRNEMPVTIGVFVDPGHKKDQLPEKRGWRPRPENRSVEYDTLSDTYVNFLVDEILAEVKKGYNITEDPAGRAICGASSGGICAFTVAWQRPDKFGKVVSHIGSFTNIRHGDTYPGLIRKTERKPIRVYLQDGSNDLDNQHGNWPLANQQMYAALSFKEYDVKFDYGEGAHNGNHGGAMLPYALRWLWRDYAGVAPKLALIPVQQDAKWALKWWLPRHELKLAERKVMPRVDLLMIGDSITHSWESGGKPVWDQYYSDRNALNLGFSGDRTEHVLWRLQNGAVDDINPKLAVLMIGTNNTGHRQEDPSHTAAGIKRIIEELQARLPDMKILLLGVFPRAEKPDAGLRKINDKINQLIREYADNESVWYLDLGDKFLDEQGQLPKSIMPDFLHPNRKGYEIWAEAMEPLISKLMK